MFRIKALNETVPPGDEDDQLRPKEACQEILVEAALKRYKEGLMLQKDELWQDAADVYKEVLSYPVIMKAEPVEDSTKITDKGLSPLYGKTGLSISYACYKNLAEVHRRLKLYEMALDYYSEALKLDGTDVTVWYRSGLIASKLGLIELASHAFLQGLQCSSQNWPCLDRACVSLYVEGDYTRCLELISNCFDINEEFARGYVLRDLILEEQPSLKQDILELCPNVNLRCCKKYSGSKAVADKVYEEVKTLRSNRDALKKKYKTEPVRSVKLTSPMEKLSWLALGKSLISLKNWMLSLEDPISLLTPVDLLEGVSQIKTVEQASDAKQEDEPMDVISIEEAAKESSEEEAKESENEEKRGKRRSGSTLMEELLWSGKRRSARVRSSRKEHESWSVADALRTILPRKLLHQMKVLTRITSKSLDDDSMDTMELYKLFEKQGSAEKLKDSVESRRFNVEVDRDVMLVEEAYFGTLQEESDVKAFLEAGDKKGIFDILQSYVSSLQEMWVNTWPKPLLLVFTECYKVIRPTDPLRWTKLHDDQYKNSLLTESGAILLYLELALDEPEIKLEEDDLVFNLHGLKKVSGEPSHFPSPEAHATFLIRFLWVCAHINLKQGNTSSAIMYLNAAIDSYEELPALREKTVRLRNCRRNNEITKNILQATLAALSRKRSLAEVIRLYENGNYEEVKKTLIESFISEAANVLRHQDKELVDRQTQLAMLVNALHHLEDYKECVYWLEVSCHELLGKMNNSDKVDDEEENQTWKVEFDRLLVAIEECCEQGHFQLTGALPLPRLSRFVQTLCCVICRQIEDKERPPCASRPWTMLNTILLAMEESEEKEGSGTIDASLEETDLPASVMVLFTAHEYLGRREWCNCDGNVLLLLILDQVIPKLRLPEWGPFRETVQQHLEQVVFCLYAHPNKKSKARYITDHNVSPIELTWERAMQLFELFRPDEIPCFDSLRANIIAADTEVLFRRISALMPHDIDPTNASQSMTDFLYGKLSSVPTSVIKLPAQVVDLFYILGDYYVKTHESAKAVNYLLIDLCANPDRVDSWASIAFSKVYMLELQLNSCAPINNEEFLEEAMAVTRCFEHCLKLDRTICTIWIEYGNFSYSIHSFCSQRMKLESDSLSLEQFEEIETTKTKMLDTAKNAFMNANLVWSSGEDADRQDERWLHHYMLGKICEKHGDLSYLEYYNKAAQLLYENNAQYPKKISYNAPQTYAIEALEIYYRIHVCVIKCLELQNGEPLDEKTRNSFVDSLNVVSKGPLATLTSKSDLQRKNAKAEEEKEVSKKRTKEMVKAIIEEILDKVIEIKTKPSLPQIECQSVVETKNIEEEENTTNTIDEKEVSVGMEVETNEKKRPGPEDSVSPAEPAKKKMKVEAEGRSAKQNEDCLKTESKVEDSCVKDKNVISEEPSSKKTGTEDAKKHMQNTDKTIGKEIKSEESSSKKMKTGAEDAKKDAQNSDNAEVKSKKVMEVDLTEAEDGVQDVEDVQIETPEQFQSSIVVLNSSDLEDNEEAMQQYQALSYAPSAQIPPNQPVSYVYEPYPHEQLLDDNYYMTLDDFREEKHVRVPSARPALPKMRSTLCKKRPRQRSVSPASSVSSESIKYADDSSSSSSSSSVESKKSRATSSSSESSDSDDEIDAPKTKLKEKPPADLPKSLKVEKTDEISSKKEKVPESIQEKEQEPIIIPESTPPSPTELDPEVKMLHQCLRAFETCALRFPQHYKSIYRLAHFFYRSKQHRDLNKCRDLLLGQFKTSCGVISGLFSERKNTNFFNGIWRLPAGDVDRPGSFASHMSRSVLLLMEVLRDLRDHKLLFEMSLQLRKAPEPDKRYLREDERRQLSKQALTLSLQTSRHVARNTQVMTLPIVLDAYRVYRKAQKHIPGKEGAFGECLMLCFKRLGKGDKCSLDQCLRFCQGEITGNRVRLPMLPVLSSFGADSSKPKIKKPKKDDVKLPPKPAQAIVAKPPKEVNASTTLDTTPIPSKSPPAPTVSSSTTSTPVTSSGTVSTESSTSTAVSSSFTASLAVSTAASSNIPVTSASLVPATAVTSSISIPSTSSSATSQSVVKPTPKPKHDQPNDNAPTVPLKSAAQKTESKKPKAPLPAQPESKSTTKSQQLNLLSSLAYPPLLSNQTFPAFPMDVSRDAFLNQYAFMQQYFSEMQKKVNETMSKPKKQRHNAEPSPAHFNAVSSALPLAGLPSSLTVTPSTSQKSQPAQKSTSSTKATHKSFHPPASFPAQKVASKSSSMQKAPQPAHNAPTSSIQKATHPTTKTVPKAIHKAAPPLTSSSQKAPQPAHKPMPPPSASSHKAPPPAHKHAKSASQASQQQPSHVVIPPRPAVQQSPPNSSKFSIDDILGRNPGLSIVHTKGPTSKTDDVSDQTEAINLSPQRKSQSTGEPVKSNVGETNDPLIKNEPELITLDD